MAMNGWDFVGFTPSQSGPGGATALSTGEVGGGTVQAAGAVPQVTSAIAAPSTKSWSIPPVVWMFIFILVGYWGLHMTLKAV